MNALMFGLMSSVPAAVVDAVPSSVVLAVEVALSSMSSSLSSNWPMWKRERKNAAMRAMNEACSFASPLSCVLEPIIVEDEFMSPVAVAETDCPMFVLVADPFKELVVVDDPITLPSPDETEPGPLLTLSDPELMLELELAFAFMEALESPSTRELLTDEFELPLEENPKNSPKLNALA